MAGHGRAVHRGASLDAASPLRSRTSASRPPREADLGTRLRAADRGLRRRLRSRETLLDLVRSVNATLDPVDVAAALIRRVASWLPVPFWALLATDPSDRVAVLSVAGSEWNPSPLQAVAEWVLQNGALLLSADVRHDPRLSAPNAAAAVAFPLIARGARIGALVGLDPATSARELRLSPTTLRELEALLEPAAEALDKALLLKRAEALSVTDDLTRLYNSRYLNQVLRRETKRAKRAGRPLSLLFIDLDGFKAINDTHGHLSGSRALVEAGAIIRSGARETDVVARFGGDEFALVLPDTGVAGAIAAAERVRDRIAGHAFLAGQGLSVHLTASVGVSTFPDMAQTADELVQAADAAMYQVKAVGKNGIQAAPVAADR